MTKELEALYRINQKFVNKEWANKPRETEKDFELIETALKRLEEIDKVMFLNNQKMEKQDEILRIIKEKKVNISMLVFVENDLEVFNSLYSEDRQLTQAEFDLLKEWLGNETTN